MKTLYCLQLQKNKFYVGQTPKGRFKRRLWEHHHGGAKWTTRFPPLHVLWTRVVSDLSVDLAEDEACIHVMLRHGPNSCRGGSFNICRNVSDRGPRWMNDLYKHYWKSIVADKDL